MRLLIVEDELEQRELIKTIIEQNTAHRCETADSAEAAFQYLSKSNIDLVISDWKLPGKDGLSLLETIRKDFPGISFILVTAYGSISHAVSSMRAGADDYLAKPFEKQQLIFSIAKVENARKLSQENAHLKQESLARDRLGEIVGASATMQKLYQQIEKLAPTTITILIHGESGTGKELVAKALHNSSDRADKLFLPVNCSAIPESLAEAELFGAEKGSYTGATQRRLGKIEAANHGTLFLDEIAELPLMLQAKLLRFLQEGRIMRVGGNEEIEVDVRVLAATHKNLLEEVKQGNFREDLYYRLNVVPLELPPLRERRDDLPALISYFTKKYADQHRCKPASWSKDAMKKLYEYAWPGNIRELSNIIERLTVLNQGTEIGVSDLPFQRSDKPSTDLSLELPPEGIVWDDYEKQVLLKALEQAAYNRSRAAKLLGLNYKAFLYRLDKHEIKVSK